MRTVSRRNAAFQQWQALLVNRSRRHRSGEFLVHGVRPITLAVEHGWPLAALLSPAGTALSRWATELIARAGAEHVEVSRELMGELADRDTPDGGVPELIAVARTRPDELSRIRLGATSLLLALDRPASPGNLGTMIRSAEAFGAVGVIVAGHATDIYDPRTVRASTGSVFAVPTVRVPSADLVADWLDANSPYTTIIGTDEHGDCALDAADLSGSRLIVIGTEATGMSAGWRARCAQTVSIPIGGAASSLNAAVAASIVLYEATRQRRNQPA